MRPKDHTHLTRRERQIMDALYARGHATAAEVRADLPDPPSYSAVRAMLAKLEAKGHVEHRSDGPRYVYAPTLARGEARRSASQRLIRTFFDGSVARAVTGLLDTAGDQLSREELDELAAAIERARAESGR